MAEKTTGQWVGTVVGAVAGYVTGGTSYILTGAALGAAAGGVIDPPKGPKIQGPRLNDLTQQTASYGTAIPRVYGTTAMMGNIFWIENNSLKETSHTEGGGKGGGGGTETTTYTYTSTFALGLCEGPIAGIRRIWIMGNLIYDSGSSDINTIAASNAAAQGFTIHYGDESQLPDSRMQSTLGVANTPAFRGLAYIVFNDLELSKYGNTLQGAQIKVEVVSQASVTGWSRTTTVDDCGVAFDKHGFSGAGKPYIIEESGEVVIGVVGSKTRYMFSRSGEFIGQSLGDVNCCESSITEYGKTWFSLGKATVPELIKNANVWCYLEGKLSTDGTILRIADAVTSIALDGSLPADRCLLGCALDVSGNSIFLIMGDVGVAPYASNYNSVWYEIDLTGFVIRSGNMPNIGYSSYSFGFSRYTNNNFASCCFDSRSDMFVTAYGAGTGQVTVFRIDSSNNILVEASLNISYFDFSYPSVYIINGIVYAVSYNDFNVFTNGLLTKTNPILSSIASAECLRSKVLSSADIDVSALTDTVNGYRIANPGAIRGSLETLQGAFPFDVIQSGYKIKAIRRGSSSSVATIDSSELGTSGDNKSEILTQTREMDTQIPSVVRVQHIDPDREYGIGEQYAERLNTTSINESVIDMSIVLTSTDAAKISEVLLYLYWLERKDFSFSLPPTYRHLEPGDVITINTDDASYPVRLTKIAYQTDGAIDCTAKPYRPIYSSAASGAYGDSASAVIPTKGQTALALVDTGCLLESMDTPAFLVAACGYSDGWPGASVYRSSDGGATYSPSNAFILPSTIGYATNALTGTADYRMIDKASSLSMRFYGSGEISSVTEAQMLNGSNHFAYGIDGRWEIIAAQNATLQGDGGYILTDLLRGRFGTEWAMGSHAALDMLVLLNKNTLQIGSASLNTIGIDGRYKPVTIGKTLDSAAEKSFTYRGVNLECLAPVYLNGSRHPSTNDWTLTWVRRTRVGGEWRDYVDATLGESSESYEVEIYSSAAYTTLKRTISGIASATTSYTSANQVTDFGSNQSTLYVKIYQLSANVGRGYPLTTSITR